MTADLPAGNRWARIRSLFGQALDLEPGEREAWLREAAAGDELLLGEVRSLLGREEDAGEAAPGRGATLTLPAGHPAQIGPYRILSLLGEGGMGAVYLAEQAVPRRHVAVKVLRIALASGDARRRFTQEGEVLGRLRHPAVAQVYEMGTATLAAGVEVPYLVMEHVRGARSLTQFVRETAPERGALLELFCHVVDGVEHAHQQGVVHRDLKPANVVVDVDGRAKVIDFGLARAVGDDSGMLSMHTRTGQVMGTPTYMSPEQFEGKPEGIGLGTDIYSLGVVLYELIAGRLPHDLAGLPLAEMARTVRDEPPRLLSDSTGTRLRDDLDTIVGKALEKQPERRYETAAALAADVRRYLRNEPIHARPASAMYRTLLFARRHRVLVASVVVVLLVALAAAGVSLQYAFDARRRADEADRSAYRAQILGAEQAIVGQHFTEASELIAATPERLRGWEYRHLESRLDRTLPSPWPAEWKITGVVTSADSNRIALRRSLGSGPVEWVVLDGDLRTERLVAPDTEVPAMALSPDGTRAVWAPWNAGDQRPAVLWSVETGAVLATIPTLHPCRERKSVLVTWSPDGHRFAISHVGGFQIHEGTTGALLASRDLTGYVRFTGDERWMILQAHQEDSDFGARELRLLDARTLQPHGEPFQIGAPTGLVSCWRSRLACAVEDGTLLLVDIADGKLGEHLRFSSGINNFNMPTWSTDGRLITLSSASGDIRVWDAESGAECAEFSGSQSGVTSQFFLPDSGDLWACALNGQHRAWPMNAGTPGVLTAHKSFVYPAVVSRDGSLLLTGGWDGFVGESGGLKCWDARTGAMFADYGLPGEIFKSADLTPDGWHAVAGIITDGESERRTEVIDLATGTVATTFGLQTGAAHPVCTVVFPDGKRVVSVDALGETSVWELATGKVLWKTDLQAQTDARTISAAAAVSPDGRLLALADQQLGLRLVDADTYADIRHWHAHERGIWSLAFSPDGQWLLSASDDQTIGVWDVPSGALVARLVGHGAPVYGVAMSPDGTRIASGGRDGVVRLWDTTHFENVAQLRGHTDYIFRVTWSPDGLQLFSTSGDSTVRIWDTRTLAEQIAARRARSEALPGLQASIGRASHAAHDPAGAVAAVFASPEFDARQRELARQVAAGFAARGTPAWCRAPRAASPIVLDGRIDETAWAAAPWSDPFVDIEGEAKPKPRFQTRMRMLWDDSFLYVAAQLEEPHVWSTLHDRDDIVFRDNDFEIFLDPEGDARWYGEIEVNALATIFDLRLERPYVERGTAHHEWSAPGMRAAVSVDGTLNDASDVDRGWTAEIAIPYAAFADHATAPLPPRPGDVWRINFSRVEWQHDVVDGHEVKRPGLPEDNWAWTPQHVCDMHRPEQWGFVELVAGDG